MWTAREMDEELPAGGAFRRHGSASRGARRTCADGRPSHGREPARQRRLLLRISGCPTSGSMRSRSPARGRDRGGHARPRRFLRDVMRLNRDQRNFRVFGPDETASNRLTPCSRSPTARGWPSDAGGRHCCRGAGDGDPERAHLPGMARGLPAHGPPWLFSCYEAFIHVVDSMFNQHAKWLKVSREIPWRRPCVAELSAHLARLATGPQRLLAPGPGLHRPRRQQEGGGDPGLLAAGRQHAALGGRSLPAEPELRQCDRRRQAAGPAVPRHGRGDQALHRRHRDLDVGQQRSGGRA